MADPKKSEKKVEKKVEEEVEELELSTGERKVASAHLALVSAEIAGERATARIAAAREKRTAAMKGAGIEESAVLGLAARLFRERKEKARKAEQAIEAALSQVA